MKTHIFGARRANVAGFGARKPPRVDELELPKSSISASTRRHPVGLRRYRDFQDGGNLYGFRQRLVLFLFEGVQDVVCRTIGRETGLLSIVECHEADMLRSS